jgi:GNAT superfamily N-acetyltransferase
MRELFDENKVLRRILLGKNIDIAYMIQYTSLSGLIKHYWDFVGEIQEKYMGLLENLSTVEKISMNTFIQNILEISKRGSILIGYLGIPGSSEFEIVVTGTLFLEVKLSHGGKPVGHIEDIIVHPNYRGKNLSYFIVNKLISIATVKQCYKVILQCKPELCGIYERNGFIKSGVEMVYRF